MTNTITLVADIGGTNTRVALANGIAVQTDTIARFANADFDGLSAVLAQYLSTQDIACDAACVAVAGPVHDGVGRLTNLDWHMDSATLQSATGAKRTSIVNDLQAQAHAVNHLTPTHLKTVIASIPQDGPSNKLVIGMGTGFNIASVVETSAARIVPPAEAGHASLPVRRMDEFELARHLESAHGFAAIEDMLSGRGMERVYAWRAASQKTSAQIIQSVDDDPHAADTLRMMTQMLGKVAGDLALTYLPFGGIYLAGGLARALSDHFDRFGFATSFRDKGRFSEFMDQFSVQVITDDNAALTGCACHIQNGS